MKSKTFSFLSSLLILAVALGAQELNAQITVIIQQTPPYQFKLEHMWKVTLVNPTQTTYRISLHGRATELYEGLIVEATTAALVLPPGMKVINALELVPINIRESNPKYADVVKNIGGVTAGDYEIFVSVIDAEVGRVLGFQCVRTKVQSLTQVELLEPANGARYSSRTEPEVWNQPVLCKVL